MRKKHPGGRIACAALTVVAMMIAMVAVAQAQAPPQAPQPPEPKVPPALVPSYVVDLMTADGIGAFEGRWKTMEAKSVEGPALPNAMPGYTTSYCITPHCGEAGCDVSACATIRANGAA